jgi:hypothetical protein
MTAAGYGIGYVSRGFQDSPPLIRMFGILSALAACLAAVIGFFYAWISVLALQVYLQT